MTAHSANNVDSVVQASWLVSHYADPAVRVIDARWSLKTSGRAAYAEGHVPGAAFLDLDVDLSAPSGPGRHPIPDRAQVATVFGRIGVARETHVVAYDDAGGAVAARVWFLLRRHQHLRVSILDGGFRAWLAAKGPISRDVPHVEPRVLELAAAAPGDVVDKVYVSAMLSRVSAGEAVLLDARSGERYRGESEPIDARAGHIPGAKNAPWDRNLGPDEDGTPRLLPNEALRAHYRGLGVEDREVVVYCGSSVTACLDLLALERAGFGGARVYEGSWSDWARDASLPAARGDEP